MSFKSKPTVVYREEDHTSGRGAVRQTFDRRQYENWRRYDHDYSGPTIDKRFFVGSIVWRQD